MICLTHTHPHILDRFGHSSVSDDFEGKFRWGLASHFLDSLWDDGRQDFFVRGGKGTNWMHEMVWRYDQNNNNKIKNQQITFKVGAANQKAPAADLEVGNALRSTTVYPQISF